MMMTTAAITESSAVAKPHHADKLPVYRAVLEAALGLPGSDVEDIVQIACAQLGGLDLIVTRDTAGFHHAPMPAVEPAAIASYLAT